MPPTVQTNRDDRDRRNRTGERRSDLICKVKYSNTLPDIPFDPKFITYPFESNRYVQYNPTSLEGTYKHELLTEHDLGVTVDLINPEIHKSVYSVRLEPEDEKLLEEESATPQDSKRSRHHNKNVSWMRRTEYISTEYNRFTQSAEKAESKVGFSIKKYLKEDDLYKDKESQIQAIEQTFEDAKVPITKHYSKPGVVPIEVLPVYPDFELWKHPCAQVIFDTDPAPVGRSYPAQVEEMSQAMIRGMVDESGDQFVAYFLPSDDTIQKRKRDVEAEAEYMSDDEYDYVLAREYNWNVKNKATKGYEESYFFVFKDTGVYYNELETRVRLSKRRKLGEKVNLNKTRLVVKHRPLNELELNAQDLRTMMLEPAIEEEEEEEVEETKITEEENVASGSEAGDGSDKEGDDEKPDDDDDKASEKSVESTKSRSRSRSRSGSRSPQHSDKSVAESDTEAQQKKAEEEIFGSASSSEDDD